MRRKLPPWSRHHESWCAIFRSKTCDCDDGNYDDLRRMREAKFAAEKRRSRSVTKNNAVTINPFARAVDPSDRLVRHKETGEVVYRRRAGGLWESLPNDEAEFIRSSDTAPFRVQEAVEEGRLIITKSVVDAARQAVKNWQEIYRFMNNAVTKNSPATNDPAISVTPKRGRGRPKSAYPPPSARAATGLASEIAARSVAFASKSRVSSA